MRYTLGMRNWAVLILAGATLIDPKAKTTQIADLLIKDGHVVSVVPAAGASGKTEEGAVRVDLRGKFVMPGLVDLHVHSWGNTSVIEGGRDDEPGRAAVLARMLYAGVVAALDLGTNPDEIFPLRDKQRADPESVPGAALFAAGPVLGTWIIPTPELARERVSQLAKRKPDVVKLMFDHVNSDPGMGMNSRIFNAAAAEARKAGLKTVVHIGTWEDAAQAVEGGASAITHLFDAEEIPVKLARRMKELGVVEIPTMAVQGDLYRVSRNLKMLEDPLLVAVAPPWFLAQFRQPVKNWKARARNWLDWQEADIPVDFVSIKRLLKAGVPLLTGSDAANYATFQGYSEHREIELLHEAGLSVWDALAAGTTRSAGFLGKSFGVEPGDEAELIVLSASPLADIRNTRKVEALVHLGRYWGAAEREKLRPLMTIDDREAPR
jgi:imidazolonepropionase-like amidohydrolase